MPLLQVENMTHYFGGLRAVHNFNLEIEPGQIRALIGPNGAGKTTTLRMLAGIMDPSEGSARVAGFDVVGQAPSVKEHTAYMSQRFALYPDLTAKENVAFYADLYGVPRNGRDRKINELLDFSGMLPFKQRRAANLSGGMKQRAAIAMALCLDPDLMVLDEPTSALDVSVQAQILNLLKDLQQEFGLTYLFISHDLSVVEYISDRVAVMYRGEIVADVQADRISRHRLGLLMAGKGPP